MDQNNPYAAPQVALVDAQGPRALPGWSMGQLQMLGWLHLLYLLCTLVVVGMTFAPELADLADGLEIASTLFGSYLLLRLKAFLEARFAVAGLIWPVWLTIGLSVALELVQQVWTDSELVGLSMPSLLYFGLMALLGLITLWLGIVLFRVKDSYPSLRVLAWLYMISGVLVASVILLVIGILPMLAAMVASALVFFHGARELRGDEAERG
ncbi:MAG: hypothetical protein ACRCTL_05970 [Pseudomonas sp.]